MIRAVRYSCNVRLLIFSSRDNSSSVTNRSPLSVRPPEDSQFIQCLAGLFQTPEEIRHTRIVLVDEIMAHNAAVLG